LYASARSSASKNFDHAGILCGSLFDVDYLLTHMLFGERTGCGGWIFGFLFFGLLGLFWHFGDADGGGKG
jgi:hypothetical protein